ncbi:MAG TPA: pirin family protein, partial [Terriglobales bacterium]
TGSIIRPGDGQRMSAGTGIRHSEYNASTTEPVHLLQIWILPEEHGIKPGYEQKAFPEAEKQGKLRALASRDGRDSSVMIHQDAVLYSSILANGESVEYDLARGRYAWLQVARGSVNLNGKELGQGDGAAVSDEDKLTIAGTSNDKAEVLLFDLA